MTRQYWLLNPDGSQSPASRDQWLDWQRSLPPDDGYPVIKETQVGPWFILTSFCGTPEGPWITTLATDSENGEVYSTSSPDRSTALATHQRTAHIAHRRIQESSHRPPPA